MPHTFGAATSDRVNFTVINNIGFNGTLLVCGWFYPTTLTAGRELWSIGAGGITGVQIDTTTTSLRLILDNVTTDGVWTAPAGLVTNTWQFIAVLLSSNATPVTSWKVFTGTIDTPPVERTVTQVTAPVGAVNTSATAFYVGNTAGATVAFQGDISDVNVVHELANGDASFFGLAAHGTFNVASDYLIPQRILAAWEGDYDRLARLRSNSGSSPYGLYGYWPGESANVESPFGNLTATITGATPSLRGSPRPRPSGRPLVHSGRGGSSYS